MSTDNIPPGAPAPRLCHIVKWPDYDEYGFNLHAEKAKTGQYIGKVDKESPADYAGLQEGDRIIEVNDVNIANENHKQVVERVKSIANETKLLVLDEEADKYYKEKKIVVKNSQHNVLYKKTPPIRPSNNIPINGNGTTEESVSRETNGIHESNKTKSKSVDLSTEAPAPRLCHIVKWSSSDDYGFNLHAEKNVNGQFIGKVDENSPAHLAGLREGDRIIEVNGANVCSEGHKQLVDRIKVFPNETKLLVLDEASERWYRERKLVARSTQPNVIYTRTPVSRPQSANHTQNGGVLTSPNIPEMVELPLDAPAPRLCHMLKWPGFEGYGFTLHAEKQKSGQYIGKIDPDSPAEYAGLLDGDRIIEVNNANVSKDSHHQLVERIKSKPNETQLLVIDAAAERWYAENQITPSSAQQNVIYMKTPFPRPILENPLIEDNYKNEELTTTSIKEEQHEIDSTRSSSPMSKTDTAGSTTGSLQDSPRSTKSAHSQNGVVSSTNSEELNLNMSVSQMRQLLANRKKTDPKKAQIDLREKYNIIQDM